MKKKRFEQNDRLGIAVSENEITKFQTKTNRKKTVIAIPWILFLIWIAILFGSVIFDTHIYTTATLEHLNHSSRFLKEIGLCIEQSYNLFFHAGPTGQIENYYIRILCCGLAGASLASCGTVFQGTFKNVLAGPSTMGVMAGGTLGCMVYLMCFYTSKTPVLLLGNESLYALWQNYQSQICILAGCFGGVALVLAISLIAGRGRVSSSAMVIAGMVFSGIISNITMVCQYLIIAQDPSDSRVEAIRDLMMGNMDRLSTLQDLCMMGIPVLLCLFILLRVSGRLNLLSLGTEEAMTMGINVSFYRNIIILLGTVLTAMVVSFCGQIGFIGFMVPLVMRRLAGPDLKKLLPYSMLGGAIFLTIIYDIVHIFMLQGINVVTGPLGCIMMTIALFRKGGAGNAARKQKYL